MEPMTIGSPNTSQNASLFENTASNSQFLPSFLLGSDHGNNSQYTSPKSITPNKSQFSKFPSSPVHTLSTEKNILPSPTSTIEKHDGPPIISLADYSVIHTMNQSSVNNNTNTSVNNSRDFIGEDFSENWVTIFGFSPFQLDLVLSYFVRFGQIIDKKHSCNGGNWIHVKYSNRRESLNALSQNGKQISPNLMIGVLSRKEKYKLENMTNRSFAYHSQIEPTSPKLVANSVPFSPTIRRLTVANEDEVVPLTNLPTKSSGVVSKAMEYLFGW